MVGHEFRHTPQRAYIKQLVTDGYIGRFQLCTLELFLDRYVTREPRPLSWMARRADGGGILGALGSHYIDGLRHWFGDVATASGRLLKLRPDVIDTATGRIVTAETDDAFTFTLEFEDGGIGDDGRVVRGNARAWREDRRHGRRGNAIAEQPGPNPMEDGVVIGSRHGSALQPLPTPSQYTPFTDGRDHRLMAFRLLVRDFTRGIDEGTSPAPNFDDGLKCQQVMDAIRESSETGRTIRIE